MSYQCYKCGMPVLTERCGETLHIHPCPKCAHHDYMRGYDRACERQQEREQETSREELEPLSVEWLKSFRSIL